MNTEFNDTEKQLLKAIDGLGEKEIKESHALGLSVTVLDKNHNIVEVGPDGNTTVIKKVDPPAVKLPQEFIIK